MRIALLLSLTLLVACGNEATLAPATAPEPAPSIVPAQSDAAARADALVAQVKAREEAQSKFDRENPPPPPPRIEDLVRPSSPVSDVAPVAAPVSNGTPAPQAPAPTSASSADPKQSEAWWKDQARNLQVKLDDDTSQMNQARNAMMNSTLRITAEEAEREYRAKVAIVQNSRAALDRMQDDGRRAGVPAGWTRWP